MKTIYTGIESSGKSLMLARICQDIVKRNSKWYKKTGLQRPIYSNIPFSPHFITYAEENNVPIFLWHNLEDVIYNQECDVIIDEILKYFDSRNWSNLSLDAKHWLTQGAKSGVHVYGSAQDFSQVDKSFRLLVNKLYVITKIIGSARPMKTAPSSKYIWGVCMSRMVKPSSFKGDNNTLELIGFPSFFMIDKKDCSIFDTNAKIMPSESLPLKHVARWCEICKKYEVKHF